MDIKRNIYMSILIDIYKNNYMNVQMINRFYEHNYMSSFMNIHITLIYEYAYMNSYMNI